MPADETYKTGWDDTALFCPLWQRSGQVARQMIMDTAAHQFFVAVEGGRKNTLMLGDVFRHIHLIFFRIDKLLEELLIDNTVASL